MAISIDTVWNNIVKNDRNASGNSVICANPVRILK